MEEKDAYNFLSFGCNKCVSLESSRLIWGENITITKCFNSKMNFWTWTKRTHFGIINLNYDIGFPFRTSIWTYCAQNSTRFVCSLYYIKYPVIQRLLMIPSMQFLTYWGRVTNICVSKLTIIGSNNGLSPDRRQAIIWTNAGLLLIRPLGTNFSKILIEILKFSFKKSVWMCRLRNGGHFVPALMC